MTWREMVGQQVFSLAGPNRGLMLSVWWQVALLVGSLAIFPFDRRRILGLNPWVKPLKFELSVLIFLLTIAVLLSALGRSGAWPQLRIAISWGIGIVMIVENTIIVMQSARGVRSHMNYATGFDSAAFGAMGLSIAINTGLVALLLVLYLRTATGLPAAITLGIQLGLVVVLAGSVEGVMMAARYSAHTVGAPDGSAGLPFVNWSTGHGDLRVAHFFALHALQIFILVGWAISRGTLPLWTQRGAVCVFVAAYCWGVWWLFAEAIAGRPFWGGT